MKQGVTRGELYLCSKKEFLPKYVQFCIFIVTTCTVGNGTFQLEAHFQVIVTPKLFLFLRSFIIIHIVLCHTCSSTGSGVVKDNLSTVNISRENSETDQLIIVNFTNSILSLYHPNSHCQHCKQSYVVELLCITRVHTFNAS